MNEYLNSKLNVLLEIDYLLPHCVLRLQYVYGILWKMCGYGGCIFTPTRIHCLHMRNG